MATQTLYSNVFPSPIAPDEEKNKKEYAKRFFQAAYQTSIVGPTSYYYQRNSKFAENRLFANGKQPFSAYLSLMGIQGKQSFLNLDYHPRPVAPKFRDILINTIMEKIERVECTALSPKITKRKQDKKNDAAFRMTQGDFIGQLQNESGVQFEQPDSFVPDSEEELELWYELHEKEQEEILMEEGINFVLYNNDWESIKRNVVGDLVDNALACTQNYFDGCKRIRIRRIKPEYLVYGTTQGLDFKDVPYRCHMERMTIMDVRALWPEIPEQDLYRLASNWVTKYGNPNSLTDYTIDFQTAYTRPYDSFLIDVMFGEYNVTKYVDYVKGEDNNGRPIFDYKKGKDTEKKTAGKKPIPTIYSGAWLIGSDIIPQWGEMPDMLRSNTDTTNLQSSYSIYMLNNDGTMMPKSPIDEMKSSIIQMDLAILKIQQHLAGAAPDGARIDIDSALEIDLGQGIGKVGALKLREIRLMTGDEYWSSSKASGEANRPPIEQAIHSLGDKIQQFIMVYNFELGNIRDYIGVNEIRDGSAVPDRLGLGVQQNQIKASNTATAHIYAGFVNIMTNTAKAVSMRLWDALKYMDANDMYMRILGQKNMEFITKKMDITASNYDVMIQVNQTADEVNFLEENIAAALQQGTIELEDSVVVRDYAKVNMKKAVLYLSFVKKKRAKEATDQQIKISTAAQQQQSALLQQQQKQKAEDQKAMDQLEIQKTDQKGRIEIRTKQQELINDALLKQMETNPTVLPEYVQALINAQVQQAVEEEQAQMQAEQEQQMMMEQQQQQENPEMQEQPEQEEMQPEMQPEMQF